jgi:hypothetical protein
MEHDGAPLCLGRVVFWVVHGFTCGHRFEDVDEHGRILELGSVCNLARCSLCGVRVESIFHDFELYTTLPRRLLVIAQAVPRGVIAGAISFHSSSRV